MADTLPPLIVHQSSDKPALATEPPEKRKRPAAPWNGSDDTDFGAPRDFLDNRFVYAVLSARAQGLSVGVNCCPDKSCNFDCVYCEVHRSVPAREQHLDVEVMAGELRKTLEFVRAGRLRERPWYRAVPSELLQLRHVALSGDGEPTLCPNFEEAVEAVVHVRAMGEFFKMVLITNATGLDRPQVQEGLRHFTRSDEIWAKLDGGSQAYLNKVNGVSVPLEKIMANVLAVGRLRPIVIQSLFPVIHGEEPPPEEIDAFSARLLELRREGAQIALVQIYSAKRPTPRSECTHLPLRGLSRIAHSVRQATGLKAEVF